MAYPIQIRLFGAFEAQVDGVPLSPLRTRKGVWLLGLLALHGGRPVERDWLAGLLWPESPLFRESLRKSLHDLRRALGPAAGRLLSPTPRALLLDLYVEEVDVAAFDAAIARGDQASLEQAVALYRGPLLEGCAEAWLLPERQAREQAYLEALEKLAARAVPEGDRAGAERHLRLALATDPLRESACRELMQVLAADGRTAAALQLYRELRLLLRRELNTRPDAATWTLFRTLCDAASAAPGRAADRRSSAFTLPHPLTRLIGREAEMDEVRRALAEHRLVTLTGVGGSGKTRLALEVAADLIDDPADGVVFVSLASIGDPSLLVPTIAASFGIRYDGGAAVLERLKAHLRNREVLLLLDNFEHLIAAAPLVSELLVEAPRLRVLATSREVLRLRGERAIEVPPLAFPDPREPVPKADLIQYPAVALFVERATDTHAGFALSPENAEAVAGICQRLDGLPLAIELAASRIRLCPPEMLLERLDSRLTLLVRGPRDLPARQRTLRDAIAWSYELLDEPEKWLFRRLAVFRGGCTVPAAEAMAGGAREDEVLDLLTSLVEKSLLRREAGADGTPRFTMLETIREFGRECLEKAGEEDDARRQHAEFFLRLAEEADRALRGPKPVGWLDRLAAEHDNFRAAVAWCAGSGIERIPYSGSGKGGPADSAGYEIRATDYASRLNARTPGRPVPVELGLRLGCALLRYWRMRGHLTEGWEQMTRLLAVEEASVSPQVRCRALQTMARLAFFLEDHDAARAFCRESMAIAREIGDRKTYAGCLSILGGLASSEDDFEASRACHEEGMAIGHELGDEEGITQALNDLGGLAYREGDFDASASYYEACIARRREVGSRAALLAPLANRGMIACWQDDGEAARRFFSEGLSIARELGDTENIAGALQELGHLAYRESDFETARRLFEESLALWRARQEDQGRAEVLCALGKIAHLQGQDAAAAGYYQGSLIAAREFAAAAPRGEMLGARTVGESLAGLGDLATARSEPKEARRNYREGLALLRNAWSPRALQKYGPGRAIARCLEGLAAVEAEHGDPFRGARLLATAAALRQSIGAYPLPPELPAHERRLAAVRSGLGEEAFAVACTEGQSMSAEQAIRYALEEDESA